MGTGLVTTGVLSLTTGTELLTVGVELLAGFTVTFSTGKGDGGFFFMDLTLTLATPIVAPPDTSTLSPTTMSVWTIFPLKISFLATGWLKLLQFEVPLLVRLTLVSCIISTWFSFMIIEPDLLDCHSEGM